MSNQKDQLFFYPPTTGRCGLVVIFLPLIFCPESRCDDSDLTGVNQLAALPGLVEHYHQAHSDLSDHPHYYCPPWACSYW